MVPSKHWPRYLQCLLQMGVELNHVCASWFSWCPVLSIVSHMAAGQGLVLSNLPTGRLWSNSILHIEKTTTVP